MKGYYLRWDCPRCGKQHTREIRPNEVNAVLVVKHIETPTYWKDVTLDVLMRSEPVAQVLSLTEPVGLTCAGIDVEVWGESR